jgi:hypothetical protein
MNHGRVNNPPNRWRVESFHRRIPRRRALVGTRQKDPAKDEALEKAPGLRPGKQFGRAGSSARSRCSNSRREGQRSKKARCQQRLYLLAFGIGAGELDFGIGVNINQCHTNGAAGRGSKAGEDLAGWTAWPKSTRGAVDYGQGWRVADGNEPIQASAFQRVSGQA